MKIEQPKQGRGAAKWLNHKVPFEKIKHRLWLDKKLISEEIQNSYRAINPKKNSPVVTGWSNIKEMIWIFVSKAWSCLEVLAEVDLVLDSLKNEDEFKRDVAYLNKRLEIFNSLAMDEMIGIETAFYEWSEPCQEFLLYQDILYFLEIHPIDQQPEEERLGNIKKIISTNHEWGDDLLSKKITIQEPDALAIWASYLRTLLFIYAKLLPINYLYIKPVDMCRIDGACICILSNTQNVVVNKKRTRD